MLQRLSRAIIKLVWHKHALHTFPRAVPSGEPCLCTSASCTVLNALLVLMSIPLQPCNTQIVSAPAFISNVIAERVDSAPEGGLLHAAGNVSAADENPAAQTLLSPIYCCNARRKSTPAPSAWAVTTSAGL